MKRIFCVFLFFLCGCVSTEEMSGLMVLKRLGDNQEQQAAFLKSEEARFQKVLTYVKEDRLEKGRSKKWVLAAFGEPALDRTASDDPAVSGYFMYRHPKEFFGSERAYLYFDKDENLASWKYEEKY